MLIDIPGTMTAFGDVSRGHPFMTFLHKTKVFGMRVALDSGAGAVFHMNGHEPKVVDELHFHNKNVLVLREIAFRFPEMILARTGYPETYAYGSAIFSGEGTFIRSANANGPFDVEIGKGIVHVAKDHQDSFWFDSWEVVLSRIPKPETLFARSTTTNKRSELNT